MFHKHPGHQLLRAALVLACGSVLSACAVSLPGGVGAVILAIIMAVLVFRPPCERDAEAAAGDGNIVGTDTGAPPDAPKATDKGDVKTTPCLSPPHPCLSTTACLCTCELEGPYRGLGLDAAPAPADHPVELDTDRQRAREKLGQRLPEDLRRRLNSKHAV